jgi:hypothetical protein
MRSRGARAGAAGLIATVACLGAAASASALGFTNLSSAPADVTAGAHSNFTQHIEFTTATDDVKNLVVHLPPGQVGDPTATPKCTVAQLYADTCPANTQVGVTTTSANVLLDLVPITIPGKVYNLVPQPGEPARFGIVLTPPAGAKVILQAGAALRQSDFGLDTIINNIPNTSDVGDITITALDLTLFGFANEGSAEEASFMRNPTSCGEAVTEFDAEPYGGAPAHGSASFTPTGCAALDFSPELSSTVTAAEATEHPTFTTLIEQDAVEAGLKKALVYLPSELQPNNDALGNQCLIATFKAGGCAASTVIGSAEASSPLLNTPVAGNAYLLDNGGGLGVGLDLQGELSFRLVGTFVFAPDLRTGNLFDGLPDIPISEFLLTIDGGDGGLITASRDLCEPPIPFLEYDFDGHNAENTNGTVDSQVLGCLPAVPPTGKVKLKNKSSKHPSLKLKAEAGSEALRSVRLKLPKGLRFAEGDVFEDGVSARDDSGELDDSALESTPRKVVATVPAAGTDVLKVKVRRSALIRTQTVKKPKFKLKLTDVEGLVTKLVG